MIKTFIYLKQKTLSLSSFLNPLQKPFFEADNVGVVRTNSLNIFENLATEEAILRGLSLRPLQSVLLLYVNRACVVLGRNQNIFKEVSLPTAHKENVLLARRNSGGGAVYHDEGNLCLSFFTHRQGYFPEKTIQILRLALCAFYSLDPQRVTTTKRHDLFLDGKKISGSAMRVQRDIAYHHCTLLLCSNFRNLGRFLKPEGEYISFKSSSVGSIRSPVTTLEIEEQKIKNKDEMRLSQEETVLDFMNFMESFYLLHHSSIMQHPSPWDIKSGATLQSFPFSNNLSPEVVPSIKTPQVVLNISEKNTVFLKLVDAEGRRPSRDSAQTWGEEVEHLGSEEWLFDMPRFETEIEINAKEYFSLETTSWSADVKTMLETILKEPASMHVFTVVEKRVIKDIKIEKPPSWILLFEGNTHAENFSNFFNLTECIFRTIVVGNNCDFDFLSNKGNDFDQLVRSGITIEGGSAAFNDLVDEEKVENFVKMIRRIVLLWQTKNVFNFRSYPDNITK